MRTGDLVTLAAVEGWLVLVDTDSFPHFSVEVHLLPDEDLDIGVRFSAILTGQEFKRKGVVFTQYHIRNYIQDRACEVLGPGRLWCSHGPLRRLCSRTAELRWLLSMCSLNLVPNALAVSPIYFLSQLPHVKLYTR